MESGPPQKRCRRFRQTCNPNLFGGTQKFSRLSFQGILCLSRCIWEARPKRFLTEDTKLKGIPGVVLGLGLEP